MFLIQHFKYTFLEFRELLLDTCSLFTSYFFGIKVNHIFRETNEAIHYLTKFTLEVKNKLI